MCSSPTDVSIMSGSTPAARYCASSNWRCLVDAGSMLRNVCERAGGYITSWGRQASEPTACVRVRWPANRQATAAVSLLMLSIDPASTRHRQFDEAQ